MRWLVAYNYPSNSWCSGGKHADYERPHWDVYEIVAQYRDEAEAQAKTLRRQHRSLPATQQAVLAELLRRVSGAAHDSELPVTDLDGATLVRLESKRLLRLMRDGVVARLTVAAFNQGICG